MAEAVASVQSRMSAWTRADLIRHACEALPAGAMADRAALETLADRAVCGRAGEQVALLSAPGWPRVQLSEAGRFRHAWEAEASLWLRGGDVTVLTEYRQHGRPHAGYAEDVLEDAARAYLHDRLNGQHAVLMAGTGLPRVFRTARGIAARDAVPAGK